MPGGGDSGEDTLNEREAAAKPAATEDQKASAGEVVTADERGGDAPPANSGSDAEKVSIAAAAEGEPPSDPPADERTSAAGEGETPPITDATPLPVAGAEPVAEAEPGDAEPADAEPVAEAEPDVEAELVADGDAPGAEAEPVVDGGEQEAEPVAAGAEPGEPGDGSDGGEDGGEPVEAAAEEAAGDETDEGEDGEPEPDGEIVATDEADTGPQWDDEDDEEDEAEDEGDEDEEEEEEDEGPEGFDKRPDVFNWILTPVMTLAVGPGLAASGLLFVAEETSGYPRVCASVRLANGCEETLLRMAAEHTIAFLFFWLLLWAPPWWRGLRAYRMGLAVVTALILIAVPLRLVATIRVGDIY
jgi:hypothetical protein